MSDLSDDLREKRAESRKNPLKHTSLMQPLTISILCQTLAQWLEEEYALKHGVPLEYSHWRIESMAGGIELNSHKLRKGMQKAGWKYTIARRSIIFEKVK